MHPDLIRYRFAVLLLGAAMALVANPVLHAFSHEHSDHLEDVRELVSDIEWSEQDVCPYCDAVSQFVEPPVTEASPAPLVELWDSESLATFYPDLRLRLYTRLRAPPFFA